jgi:hypothetical protein
VITEGGPALPAAPGPVLGVCALAAGGTLLPYALFTYGQTRVPAEIAGAFFNLEPMIGAAAGAVIFADPMGPAQVTSGAAILAGIGLSSHPLVAGSRGKSPQVRAGQARPWPAAVQLRICTAQIKRPGAPQLTTADVPGAIPDIP